MASLQGGAYDVNISLSSQKRAHEEVADFKDDALSQDQRSRSQKRIKTEVEDAGLSNELLLNVTSPLQAQAAFAVDSGRPVLTVTNAGQDTEMQIEPVISDQSNNTHLEKLGSEDLAEPNVQGKVLPTLLSASLVHHGVPSTSQDALPISVSKPDNVRFPPLRDMLGDHGEPDRRSGHSTNSAPSAVTNHKEAASIAKAISAEAPVLRQTIPKTGPAYETQTKNAVIENGIMILHTQNLDYSTIPRLYNARARKSKPISSREDLALRNKAMEVEKLAKKREEMQRETDAITELLKTNFWPFRDLALRQTVLKCRTFYPSLKAPLTYSKAGRQYPLREIVFEGCPVLVQNFSFNVFVVAFLLEYRSEWDKINEKMLLGAFSMYIHGAYSHVMLLVPGLLETEHGEDAMTITSAKTEIARLLANPLASSLPRMLNVPGAHNTASQSQETMAKTITATLPDVTRVDGPPQETTTATSSDVSDRSTPFDDSPLRQTERSLQAKYFPSSAGVIERCIACTSFSHRTWECSALGCHLCGSASGHSDAACPLQQRCGKCRELDHAADGCPEKLARAKSEAIPCDLCQSTNHTEAGCHMIWRTYLPKPEEIVLRPFNLTIRCYSCGGDGHFGPECGIYRGSLRLGTSTWSKANVWKHFSPQRQISSAPSTTKKETELPKRAFSIKGMANNPITLDSEDGDEDDTFDVNQDFIPFTFDSFEERNGNPSGSRQQRDGVSQPKSANFARENTYSPPSRSLQYPTPNQTTGQQHQSRRNRVARGGAVKKGESGRERSRKKRDPKPRKPRVKKQLKKVTQGK